MTQTSSIKTKFNVVVFPTSHVFTSRRWYFRKNKL